MRASARARRPGSRARPAHMRRPLPRTASGTRACRPLPRAASGGALPVACARVLQSGCVPLDIVPRRTKIPFSTRSPRLLNGQTGRYEKESDANYAQVQNREQEAARPHDQLHLHEPRDLPARAHLERVGRGGQAVLPQPHRQGHPAEQGRAGHPRGVRQGRAHRHRVGQRPGHDEGRARPQSGHHRALRQHGVQGRQRRRPGRRRGHHRPVRRGLLLRVHGGVEGARRVEGVRQRRGLGLGKRRRGGLHHRGGPARGPRHRRHPHAEGQHRRRQLRHVPQRVRLAEPHQALQQLRALPRADGSVEDARAAQARGRRRRLQTRSTRITPRSRPSTR